MNDEAQANQEPPPPLALDELIETVPPRDALESLEDAVIELSVMLPVGAQPSVDVSVSETPEATTGTEAGAGAFEAKLSISVADLGRHAFPPSIEARKADHEGAAPGGETYPVVSEPHLPGHLGLRPFPRRVPRHLQVAKRLAAGPPPGPDVHQATTVFTPDGRAVYQDTSYPWSCIGRVETPGGVASGFMVGPRHMLTVSHTIQWNADGSAGWVKFTPAYFDGSAPFGEAWATTLYWEGVKVVGPWIEDGELQHDYVCCVLNSRIGDLTGWMGSRVYSNSWDGQPWWFHAGYPGDLTGSQRPIWQGSIALDGKGDEVHQRIAHQGDVWPGQSGGPFFAWWDDGAPYAVADQSGQTPSENSASGGRHQVESVVLPALRDFP